MNMRISSVIIFVCYLILKQNDQSSLNGTNQNWFVFQTSIKKDSIEINIIPSVSGWGYNIIVNGKLFIHQPFIPAVKGNQSFKSVDDALKVANLVQEKIRRKILPPPISIVELDSLKIKYL